MEYSNFKVFVVVLFIIFNACTTGVDCRSTREIYGKWEVKKFLAIESVKQAKNEVYNPVAEFKQDGTVDIQLDANTCSGGFDLLGETEINIGNTGCTKICCDNEFSIKFILM
jgi:hypothetical protein